MGNPLTGGFEPPVTRMEAGKEQMAKGRPICGYQQRRGAKGTEEVQQPPSSPRKAGDSPHADSQGAPPLLEGSGVCVHEEFGTAQPCWSAGSCHQSFAVFHFETQKL